MAREGLPTTLVEELLPADGLYLQGVMVQTWAQIEKAGWYASLLGLGLDVSRTEDFNRAMRARKVSAKWTELFSSSAEEVAGPLGERMKDVLARLEGQKLDRQFAVHGAWSAASGDGALEVEYFDNKGPKGGPADWRHYAAPILREDIERAVASSDELLRELVAIIKELTSRRPLEARG